MFSAPIDIAQLASLASHLTIDIDVLFYCYVGVIRVCGQIHSTYLSGGNTARICGHYIGVVQLLTLNYNRNYTLMKKQKQNKTSLKLHLQESDVNRVPRVAVVWGKSWASIPCHIQHRWLIHIICSEDFKMCYTILGEKKKS